ncbi:hypothetical protein WR25_06388 [Diploscapter pachys]|uniref:Uncharacterized protein n=1 Tax=Diploscapter pachys TaxID=2018661 RepID=A0A2A2LZ49_9BILA|nr:hypothetical protein WR25_17116 [Diploscapter pachys]PAV91403.1 hypothetical protein WR25_06388 [Diploscapter pachys]
MHTLTLISLFVCLIFVSSFHLNEQLEELHRFRRDAKDSKSSESNEKEKMTESSGEGLTRVSRDTIEEASGTDPNPTRLIRETSGEEPAKMIATEETEGSGEH